MSNEKVKLQKLVRSFKETLCNDSKSQTRVKTVNTLLNSGHNLKLLDDNDVETIWESLFYALWYAEMGRGGEEIIAAIERACVSNYKLTKAGFQIISKKWYGLDRYRMDKFSHLARHLLSVLINHQIKLWLISCKRKKLGTRDICCKKLLKRTFHSVIKSEGLCYFLLENFAEEVTKSLTTIYQKLRIYGGKFELKSNLIIFLYCQIISFAANINMDARLLRTFDHYVMKKFAEEVLPNESQLTQILISLRIYQALDKSRKKVRNGPSSSSFLRWSKIIQEVHERCINGEYFPPSIQPLAQTIQIQPPWRQDKTSRRLSSNKKRCY